MTQSPTPSGPTPIVQEAAAPSEHDIKLENTLGHEAEVTVVVERDGSPLFRDTISVPAGDDADLAGIERETLPAGERELTITAIAAEGRSATVAVTVTDCLGNVLFYYDGEGDIQGSHSIC